MVFLIDILHQLSLELIGVSTSSAFLPHLNFSKESQESREARLTAYLHYGELQKLPIVEAIRQAMIIRCGGTSLEVLKELQLHSGETMTMIR
jgi:hypothetical protein